MISLIIKEMRRYVQDIRYQISIVLVLGLMALNGILFIGRYQEQYRDYQNEVTEERRHLDDLSQNLERLVKNDRSYVKRPHPLGFICEGGQQKLPDKATMDLMVFKAPSLKMGTNFKLPVIPPLDWAFIVKIVLSLLALMLTYDAIVGEKETGVLRMMLAHAVFRRQIVGAKFLSAWLLLTVLFTVGCLLSVCIVVFSGEISLSGADGGRLWLFWAVSTLYIALFTAIGIGISASLKSSVASLIVSLSIWIVAVFALPASARTMAELLKPIPGVAEVERRIEIEAGTDAFGKAAIARNAFDGGPRLLAVNTEFLNKRRRIREDFLRKQFNQRRWAERLAFISPAAVFQFAGESVTGTGFLRERIFIEQLRHHREALIDFARTEDAKDPNSKHMFFIWNDWGYISHNKFDPARVPKFVEKLPSIGAGLKDGMVGLMLLAIEFVALLLGAIFAFERYDVR